MTIGATPAQEECPPVVVGATFVTFSAIDDDELLKLSTRSLAVSLIDAAPTYLAVGV